MSYNVILTNDGEIDGFSLLNEKGIKTFHYPMIKILASNTDVFFSLDDYDFFIFTSKNGVNYFFDKQNIKSQDKSSIKVICNSVKNKGSLIIAVPNIDSFDSKLYKESWAGFDVPRHLYHFNHESLISFIEKQGFVYNYKKPLIFDSFYVSILSEKNRNNPFGILIGLTIGLISNFFALFSTNYSSSFYVFTKD